MRTLIFGARGQLGRDLTQVFDAHGEVRAVDLPETDITDATALKRLCDAFGPELLVNAAAYTDVRGAEQDLKNAFLVNEAGARNVSEVGEYFGAAVIYFSTDYVFDGKKRTPYVPDDATGPLGVYGQSKLAGEQRTLEANGRHFIVRTAWLYGPGGENFPEKILRAARERDQLQVVDDETGSPTHTWDLAEAALALAQTTAYGVYHAVNAGHCTRFELARQVLCSAGIDTPVVPGKTDPVTAGVARPAYSVLDTQALTEACGYTPRSWQDALEHYLARREQTK